MPCMRGGLGRPAASPVNSTSERPMGMASAVGEGYTRPLPGATSNRPYLGMPKGLVCAQRDAARALGSCVACAGAGKQLPQVWFQKQTSIDCEQRLSGGGDRIALPVASAKPRVVCRVPSSAHPGCSATPTAASSSSLVRPPWSRPASDAPDAFTNDTWVGGGGGAWRRHDSGGVWAQERRRYSQSLRSPDPHSPDPQA